MEARLGEREILFGALPRNYPSTRVEAAGGPVVTVLRIILGDQREPPTSRSWPVIEFAALLLVSTLFGGMMLYSFGFAPMVFSALPAEGAGRFIRAAFPWYYLFVIVTAAFSGGILLLSNSRSAALALAIAAVAIYARQVLMPRINAARDQQLQRNAEAKGRFGRLHRLSVVLNFVQLIAAGYVLYRFL